MKIVMVSLTKFSKPFLKVSFDIYGRDHTVQLGSERGLTVSGKGGGGEGRV